MTELGPSERKPTFRAIRRQHEIHLDALAQQSGINRTTIYQMDLGIPVARTIAAAVLDGLTELSGSAYTLENVRVPLRTIRPTKGSLEWGYEL